MGRGPTNDGEEFIVSADFKCFGIGDVVGFDGEFVSAVNIELFCCPFEEKSLDLDDEIPLSSLCPSVLLAAASLSFCLILSFSSSFFLSLSFCFSILCLALSLVCSAVVALLLLVVKTCDQIFFSHDSLSFDLRTPCLPNPPPSCKVLDRGKDWR